MLNVITTPVTPVANGATEITDVSFKANWNTSNGSTSYMLTVPGKSTYTTSNTSYTVSGLNPNSNYSYTVKGKNNWGESGSSNSIAVSTVSGPPTLNDATNITQTSFQANWNASAQATGYYLDVSVNSNFTVMVSGYNNRNVGNVTTFSVTGLSAGTNYYFRLRAYNANGTSSNSSSKSLITIPDAPTATNGTNIHQTSFSANWNSTTGATAYKLDVATDAGFNTLVSGYNNLDVSNVTTYSVNSRNATTRRHHITKSLILPSNTQFP